MIHAIGKEGQIIRQFVQCETDAEVTAQCQDGEIAVPTDQIVIGKIINGQISVTQMTGDQIADVKWEAIRTQRNMILDYYRWTFAPDSPLTTDNQSQWINYFKVLNRITVDFDDPDKVVWPTAPDLIYASSASSSS